MSLLLGVVGDCVSHSLSPLIHNGWFDDFSIAAKYRAFQVRADELEEKLQAFSNSGVFGLNITFPHKTKILKSVSNTSASCSAIGAANMLTRTGKKQWIADNTDAQGFLDALYRRYPETDLGNCRVMVLGAGGAARAVIHALYKSGASLVILNRSLEKARALNMKLCNGSALCGCLGAYGNHVTDVQMVVNATSIGHSRDIIPSGRGFGRLFYDVSYAHAAKRQLDHARMNGWKIMDGLEMLVSQAQKSFTMWFGKKPGFERALCRCHRVLGVG